MALIALDPTFARFCCGALDLKPQLKSRQRSTTPMQIPVFLPGVDAVYSCSANVASASLPHSLYTEAMACMIERSIFTIFCLFACAYISANLKPCFLCRNLFKPLAHL